MPTSTIPYDPALVLGMIVDPTKIATLEKIAELQLPVDLARDHVNALLRQKLSLDMTGRELISLGATPDQLGDFQKNINDISKAIIDAAVDLGQKVMAAEAAIVAAKTDAGQSQIGSQLQSPVDFSASQLTALPISSDSMNMDVQFFRYEDNTQSSQDTANAISTFVGVKVSSFLGSEFGSMASASANASVTSATQNHNIVGTLVICANCTSRQAQIFSPLVLDVDAAIDSYSRQTGDKMTEDPNLMKKIALGAQDDDTKNSLPVLIGASYGSSFVGFVHFEQQEDTSSYQQAESQAFQARGEADDDMLFANLQGTWGMDEQSSSAVKNLLEHFDHHVALLGDHHGADPVDQVEPGDHLGEGPAGGPEVGHGIAGGAAGRDQFQQRLDRFRRRGRPQGRGSGADEVGLHQGRGGRRGGRGQVHEPGDRPELAASGAGRLRRQGLGRPNRRADQLLPQVRHQAGHREVMDGEVLSRDAA
jgi:hypothetical protein